MDGSFIHCHLFRPKYSQMIHLAEVAESGEGEEKDGCEFTYQAVSTATLYCELQLGDCGRPSLSSPLHLNNPLFADVGNYLPFLNESRLPVLSLHRLHPVFVYCLDSEAF